jgi:hypothetical protein
MGGYDNMDVDIDTPEPTYAELKANNARLKANNARLKADRRACDKEHQDLLYRFDGYEAALSEEHRITLSVLRMPQAPTSCSHSRI